MDNSDFPELSDFPDEPNAWMLELDLCYRQELRKCRAENDLAGRETLLRGLRTAVEQAIALGLSEPWGVRVLARNTDDPQERLRLYSFAYKFRLTDRLSEWGFDKQAGAMIKAGEYLREMGLAHEALGDAAQAADCFTRALAHLQEGADLFETHCLDEDPDNSEAETFPLRPRLVTELERVRKQMGEKPG